MQSETLKDPQAAKVNTIYFQIFWVCIMYWLQSVLHFPGAITYLTDIVTVLLLFFSGNSLKQGLLSVKLTAQKYLFTIIVFSMLIGILINGVSPLMALWGARNNLRFFVFFFICVGLLKSDDVEKLISFFKKLFWVHALLCLHQYFILGYSADYLGGIFGVGAGCNTYHNIFLCLITSIIAAEYCTSKSSVRRVLIYIAICLCLATWANLKVYYVEFLMIFAIGFLRTRPSLKTAGLCLLGFLGIVLAVKILQRYDPDTLSFFLDADARENYLGGNGYTNSGDLNRFTAVQQLYQRFFKGNLIYILFGFGLGSCETSSYSFLQSKFYKEYGYLHYRWFSHAWIYLEQGAIGLLLIVLFIASVAFSSLLLRKSERKDLVLTTLAFSATTLLGLLYNCALEMDVCYIIAFMLSIPFILSKEEYGKDRTLEHISSFRRNVYRRAKHEVPKRKRFGEKTGAHSA